MTAPTRKTDTADKAAPAPEWPKTELTIPEMMDSLNGWDELAIEEHLKRPLDAMRSNFTVARALIGVHLTREGQKAPAAFKTAMAMVNDDVTKYFTKASANDDDLLAPSESGKEPAKP
jgi:hypothetical protein